MWSVTRNRNLRWRRQQTVRWNRLASNNLAGFLISNIAGCFDPADFLLCGKRSAVSGGGRMRAPTVDALWGLCRAGRASVSLGGTGVTNFGTLARARGMAPAAAVKTAYGTGDVEVNIVNAVT